MKKIAVSLVVLLLWSAALFGQQYFEGSIKFTLSIEGEGADQLVEFMPDSYNYLIKGQNMRFKINGGMAEAMIGEFYLFGETSESYMVKHSSQTAYKVIVEEDEKPTPQPTFKKMAETLEIQGYKCQKYEVSEINQETGSTETKYVWVTNEIKIKPSGSSKMKVSGNVIVEGLEGFPLKIESQMEGMTMVITAISVEKKNLPASDFEIPANYSVEKLDYSNF